MKADDRHHSTAESDIHCRPAYNEEEEALSEFAHRIDVVMSGAGLRYELVFVDDSAWQRGHKLIEPSDRRSPPNH